MPKLCLFDASGYLYRAYHALPPLSTSKGQPINAVFGFSRMVSKVLKAEKPEYVGVCFDTPKPTFRHVSYTEYKATRKEPDSDLISQMPIAEELVGKWGLAILKMDGYEADDLIATLTDQARKKGWDVVIMSGDKDILQLVEPGVVVKDEMRKVDYDDARVKERFGLSPGQLIEYFALTGDKVDNVIGVPGVGDKTATKLISDFISVDKMYKDLNGLNEKLKQKLLDNKAIVLRNRDLVTLKRDVPMTLDWDNIRVRKPNPAVFGQYLRDLEFRGEIYGLEASAETASLSENKKRIVTTVLTESDLHLVQTALSSARRIAYDIETNSLNPFHCNIVGLALSIKESEAWYIPIAHDYLDAPKQLAWSRVRDVLTPFFEDETILKCGHNLKFDDGILSRCGLTAKGKKFDTMIAAYCLDPERPTFGLKDLVADCFQEKMTRFQEIVADENSTIANCPIENVSAYAGADAEVVIRLVEILDARLKKENLSALFTDLEMPLVPVIQEMEAHGILLDAHILQTVGDKFRLRMKEIEKKIYELAGEEFLINSPKQMSQILFEKLKLPTGKRTKTGYSTNESVLVKLAKQHPICEAIISYRELSKLVSTYVESLISLADPETGRVHTSFHQTGTSTGRLSSTNPNLQNIPIRSELGQEIRRAFVAPKDSILLSADYSQIDLRCLAHISRDPVLIESFKAGGDIHRVTAAEVFHVALDQVTPEMRRRAKAINFGVVYGQQAWALSQSLDIAVEEAQDFIDRYFARYMGVRRWLDQTLEDARKNGFVTTISGRRRKLTEIHSPNANMRGFAERVAMNTPIQGSSADIIKAAMIALSKTFQQENRKTKMMVQVHDELLFEVPISEQEEIISMVRQKMESAYPLAVPLVVDIKMGQNWNDMKPVREAVAR